PRDYDFDGSRSKDQAAGFGAARTYFPAARAEWWRAGARGANGSVGGSGTDRRAHTSRGYLRNYGRGRHHVPGAATDPILPRAWIENADRGRFDPLPDAARTVCAPRGGDGASY